MTWWNFGAFLSLIAFASGKKQAANISNGAPNSLETFNFRLFDPSLARDVMNYQRVPLKPQKESQTSISELAKFLELAKATYDVFPKTKSPVILTKEQQEQHIPLDADLCVRWCSNITIRKEKPIKIIYRLDRVLAAPRTKRALVAHLGRQIRANNERKKGIEPQQPYVPEILQREIKTLAIDAKGYIAIDPVESMIILAFRGTHSYHNILTNFRTNRVNWVMDDGRQLPDVTVHDGYYNHYLAIRTQIREGIRKAKLECDHCRIVIIGHSLGGAIAQISAADFMLSGFPNHYERFSLFTFGSPRAGNTGFARLFMSNLSRFNRMIRYVHGFDLIPHIPPSKPQMEGGWKWRRPSIANIFFGYTAAIERLLHSAKNDGGYSHLPFEVFEDPGVPLKVYICQEKLDAQHVPRPDPKCSSRYDFDREARAVMSKNWDEEHNKPLHMARWDDRPTNDEGTKIGLDIARELAIEYGKSMIGLGEQPGTAGETSMERTPTRFRDSTH